jgi:hypothetical protein
VATRIGAAGSVISGGVACVAGAPLLAWLLPEFRRHTARIAATEPAPAALTGS